MDRNQILNEKCENYHAKDLHYVFVNISEDQNKSPEFTIVPSKVVAEFAKESHSTWLKSPKKSGQPRKDSSMRKFIDIEEKYLNRWDLLGLD